MSRPPGDPDVVERLRAKYSNVSQALGDADDAEQADNGQDSRAAAADRMRADSSVSARLCQRCNGTGVETEIYNHRRIDRCCGECDGEGVFIRGAPPRPTPAETPADGAGTVSREKDEASKRAAILRSLGRIKAAVKKYAQELSDAEGRLAACDADDMRGALEELVGQLRRHVESLQGQQKAFEGKLEALGTPSLAGAGGPPVPDSLRADAEGAPVQQ
ncbi:unnamed protein product [Pedinophyceae sp. YPF-701]|nr:unnamed protein product [Pedinophyceae sp. YPF-701]